MRNGVLISRKTARAQKKAAAEKRAAEAQAIQEIHDAALARGDMQMAAIQRSIARQVGISLETSR